MSGRWEIVRKDGSVQDVTNLVRLVRDKITGHPATEFAAEVVLYNGDTLRHSKTSVSPEGKAWAGPSPSSSEH